MSARTRRGLRALSSVLIISGALMLVDAGLTLAWQEPVSGLYAWIVQDLSLIHISEPTRPY